MSILTGYSSATSSGALYLQTVNAEMLSLEQKITEIVEAKYGGADKEALVAQLLEALSDPKVLDRILQQHAESEDIHGRGPDRQQGQNNIVHDIIGADGAFDA